MTRSLLSVLFIGAVALGASGCNQTVKSISIPASVAWNTVTTGLASPYSDLSVVTTGSNINAAIAPYSNVAVNTCQQADGTYVYSPDPCTGANLGVRYLYVIQVGVDRPAFQAGAVDLVSAANGTVGGLSLSVGAAGGPVKMAGAFSEGFIPVNMEGIGGNNETFVVDNYAAFGFQPHDPNFAVAAFGADPNFPDFVCDSTDPDVVLVRTNAQANMNASYTCGSIPFQITLSPPYASVGACIKANMKTMCHDQGLRGKALADCNHGQIGFCQALFNVPSANAN